MSHSKHITFIDSTLLTDTEGLFFFFKALHQPPPSELSLLPLYPSISTFMLMGSRYFSAHVWRARDAMQNKEHELGDGQICVQILAPTFLLGRSWVNPFFLPDPYFHIDIQRG